MAATTKQWALVTGVSKGGLGDALTSELLRRGINVIATGLRITDLEYLTSESSTILMKLEINVTSPVSIAVAVEETQKITNGRLDYLFNNAGYGYMSPLLDASVSSIKDNFAVNVFGVLEMVQAFFPLLHAAEGVIVNQGSIAGLPGITQPFIGSYSASKCAMMSLSDTMRIELAPFGVRVVTLVTGDVKTGFWVNSDRGPHASLVKGSMYEAIGEHVVAVMKGETNPPGQHNSSRWAKNVVDDLVRKSKPPDVIRRGYLATTMWIVSLLIPSWLLNFGFTKTARLDNLSRIHREQAVKRTG